jgi:hypothetical protein
LPEWHSRYFVANASAISLLPKKALFYQAVPCRQRKFPQGVVHPVSAQIRRIALEKEVQSGRGDALRVHPELREDVREAGRVEIGDVALVLVVSAVVAEDMVLWEMSWRRPAACSSMEAPSLRRRSITPREWSKRLKPGTG